VVVTPSGEVIPVLTDCRSKSTSASPLVDQVQIPVGAVLFNRESC